MTIPTEETAAPLAVPRGSRSADTTLHPRQLWWLVGLAIVLLLATSAAHERRERNQILDEAAARANRTVVRLADAFAQTLLLANKAIDGAQVAVQGGNDQEALAALKAYLGNHAPLLNALGMPFRLRAVNAAGQDVLSGERFQGLDGSLGALGVTAPPDGRPGWQAGRYKAEGGVQHLLVYRKPTVAYAGIAAFVLDMDIERLTKRLQSSLDGDSEGIGILSFDNSGAATLLLRQPEVNASIGGALGEQFRRSMGGTFRIQQGIDGRPRVVAFQRLNGDAQALGVAFGIDTDVALAAWRSQLPLNVLGTLLMAAALLWGGRKLDRSIRAQNLAQQELIRSESQLQALTDNLPDVLVRMDAQGRHLFASAGIEQATGIPPEAFLGRTSREMGAPEKGANAWASALQRVFHTGRPEALQFAYPGPHGSRRWESVIALEPAVPGIERTALVISRDVTERVATERAREELSRHLVELLDGMSDGFVELDAQGRCLHLNGRAQALLRHERPMAAGDSLWPALDDASVEPVRQAILNATSTRSSAMVEAMLRHDGVWVECRLHPTAAGIAMFLTDISERAARQQELARLHATLDALVECSSDAIFVKDEEGRYVVGNHALGKVLDLPLSDILGKVDQELFEVAVAERIRCDDLDLMASRGALIREGNFSSSGGDRQYRTTKGALIIGGEVRGVFGNLRDETESLRALNLLRESESRYRELFDANPLPMWVVDDDAGCFLEVNSAALALYGHSKPQFLGLSLKNLQPAGHEAAAGNLVRHVTRDGRLLDIDLTEHAIEFHARPARLMIADDLTDHLAAQRALQESEERLRMALDASRQGLFDLDLRTGMTIVSREYAAMLGDVPESFCETREAWLRRLHPQDVDAVNQAHHEYLAGKRPEYRVEFRIRDRLGNWRWILSLGKVQERDEQGVPTRMLGTHADITERREADAARKAADERFERLFNSAPEAISLTELATGRYIQVNDAFCELFGRTREGLVGRTSLELNVWTNVGDRTALLDRLASNARVINFEAGVNHSSGEVIDALFSAERVEFGGVECLLLMFRNITERKRVEKALRHSELRFRLASVYGQVWEWDCGAGGLLPAPQFFNGLGHPTPNAQDVAALFQSLIVPEDWTLMRTHLAKHLRKEGPYHLDFRAIDTRGNVRWFETQGQAVWGDDGRATYMAGTTFEITERRAAEEAVRKSALELEQRVKDRTAELERSEARYRNIFETVPVAIAETDWSLVQLALRELRANGVNDLSVYLEEHADFVKRCVSLIRLVRVNRKANALQAEYALPLDAVGLSAFYGSPEGQQAFLSELEALWNGHGLQTSRRTLASAQSERPLTLMVTLSLPLLDAADGTTLYCLVDISEVDRLNTELDQTIVRLRRANRDLETFSYSVSHDLKAPLRGIDGYSRLLLSDHQASLDAEGRRFLTNIRQASQHMGSLIDDLLAYSRIERQDVQLTEVHLAPLVALVLERARRDHADRPMELTMEVPESWSVRADMQGLHIALRNLIDNAVKFSQSQTPARVNVRAKKVGAGVRIEVSDNGVGFDMKFHDRIFTIFQRLHRAEDYPGTGVGLAIVQKAMARMGGRVWGDSKPGHGAVFTLELAESP